MVVYIRITVTQPRNQTNGKPYYHYISLCILMHSIELVFNNKKYTFHTSPVHMSIMPLQNKVKSTFANCWMDSEPSMSSSILPSSTPSSLPMSSDPANLE